MNFKAPKRGLKMEDMNPNYHVQRCIIPSGHVTFPAGIWRWNNVEIEFETT